VCEWVFRPLAHPLVLLLARLRVPPPVVVVGAGVAGLAAAAELGRGSLLAAALLIQLKTLLDNADGQLARLTGRTSAFGRYLDSEVDLLVNAALFAALGRTSGEPVLAFLGFLALTSVLSLNFNAARISRPPCCAASTASSTRRRTGWQRQSSRAGPRS
jgi:phosphatidylglycerophosphate synthase